MDRVKPPRNHYRIKSKIVSRFLHFANGAPWILICVVLSSGVFFTIGIKDSQLLNYGGWWLGLTILFIATPHLIFRLVFKYRDIPSGWTLEQARAWWEIEESQKHVRGVSRSIDWKKPVKILLFLFGYVGFLVLVLSLIVAFGGSDKAVFLIVFIVSAIIALPVYIRLYRPELLQNNLLSIMDGMEEARRGMSHRKWFVAFVVFSIGMLPIMIFLNVTALLFVPVYIGMLIFFLKNASGKLKRKN